MSTNVQRSIRRFLSDAYAFVRSQEANSAVSSVTLDQLIQEQIRRNGDSDANNSSQFNPYEFDPTVETPASERPFGRANFLGGSNLNLPTRLDRVTKLLESTDSIINAVLGLPLEATTELDPSDERRRQDDEVVDPSVFGE